jgi:hypothetical protein
LFCVEQFLKFIKANFKNTWFWNQENHEFILTPLSTEPNRGVLMAHWVEISNSTSILRALSCFQPSLREVELTAPIKALIAI